MPEAPFVINASQAGASATGTILTEDVDFAFEVTNVSIASTAAATANVTVDIRRATGGGAAASIFGAANPIGTVQTGATAQGSSGSVTATQNFVDVLPNAAGQSIEDGAVIQIDAEQMRVQAPAAGTPGFPSGQTSGTSGSPAQSGTGIGIIRAWVTRGYAGTTPATHAANASVFVPLPTLLTGQTTTGNVDVVSGPNTRFAEGDTMTVLVGGAGATGLTASIAAVPV